MPLDGQPSVGKQWGLGQVSNNVGITISLPISHANSGYKILVTHYNGVTPDSVVSLSVGQCKESDFYVSNKTNDNPAFFWFTIGQQLYNARTAHFHFQF